MNLKEMRKKAGLSQSELSSISGVNLRSLQDYEQGHKSIASAKGETLQRLSYALGYSIEQILEDELIHIDIDNNDTKAMLTRIAAYEKCIYNRKHSIVHFPIIESDSRVDMSRIYPTKQRVIKNILSVLQSDDRINHLMLFGSSITMACNKDSDIDLAVDLKELTTPVRNDISEKIQLACDWSADIIWMDHLSNDERIYKDIMKGLVLI